MRAIPNNWQVPEAQNRFSELIDLVRTQDDQGVPHHGKPVAKVVAYARHAPARTFKVTAEHDEGLQRQAAAAAPAKMTAQEFGVAYKVWIAEQHRIVQDVGIFGAEHRVW